MRLSDFLRSDFVVLDLHGGDVESVVEELSLCAAQAGLASQDVIAGKLLERERSHPTVMGAGLAIPHATVPGMSAPAIGVALARTPVAFGSADMDSVRVFFVLLSPPGREREHVKLLARICRLVRQDNFIDRLEEAPDGSAVVQVIESVDALLV